jgi:RNA polymerase sigma-70 factor (ECF subfamily)
LKANDGTSPEAREALEDLCRNYWFPLYAFARRRGLAPHDAEDATQMFFLKLLELESLKTADPERGRLRSFLLGAMSRFLAQKWRNEHVLKRGGGEMIVSIDVDQAELRLTEASGDGGEESDFDREWAYALIGRVFERLRLFHEARGRVEVFEALKGCLLGDGDYGDEAALTAGLGLTGAGVRSAVFQMRQRFRRYVEEEIRDTVDSEADLRDELAHLCRALADHRG